ncbi:MAG: hypothetical protein ABI581_17145, partial [Sediminibacterium sp.]
MIENKMVAGTNNFSARNVERFFLLIISAVLGYLFYQLFIVLERDFNEVPHRIAEGTMMNINDPKPGEKIHLLLTRGYYFSDKADIDLISSVIDRQDVISHEPMDNMGELNKNKYSINADEAW